MNLKRIETVDPEVAKAISAEFWRQQHTLELIASENFASPSVMAAQGSVMTNKYAEGYPNKRYYGGCEYVDEVERLAIERAKELFGADYVNVQAHSGSQANMAAYFALLNPGDTVLGMNLAHGGHLTHGSPVNFSGRLFRIVSYGIRDDNGRIDYDEVETIAQTQKPKLILAGASAYPRIIDFKRFADIARSSGAYLVVDMAHIAGLVAAGVHPSPIPFSDIVTSTTHKTLRGPRGGLILTNHKEHAGKINSQIFPGIQGGPLMHVIAAKAVAFQEAKSESFRTYQLSVVENAQTLAARLMELGVKLISDGTDNHMMLADLRNFNITGKEASNVLETAGITTNKNAVPGDTQPPTVTSGIRIGTPAITTRGMRKGEMKVIAELIVDVLKNPNNSSVIERVKKQVCDLCDAFPLYPELVNNP